MLNIIKLESMSKRQSLEIPVRFENFCSQLIVQFLRKVLDYITSRYDTWDHKIFLKICWLFSITRQRPDRQKRNSLQIIEGNELKILLIDRMQQSLTVFEIFQFKITAVRPQLIQFKQYYFSGIETASNSSILE